MDADRHKGIKSSYSSTLYSLNEEEKSKRDPQRRLNPIIQDAVRAEIVKLLDNRLIYPIFDSEWISPVHVVPKKSGFTMVESENKELVQTRLPTKIRVCINYQK